ncbi:MAG: accessory gene regulator B family protein [Eubacteriales bacterium]|nr:accessory gene regulator B family protein [Eubacteriales bacterium]
MEYLSLLLADRMIKCQVIEEDDKKYYAYSIQLLFEKITGILLISVFALIFKSFAEIILFLITFSLIRIHSDGIHCKTSIGCLISSVLVSLSTIPVSSVVMKSPVICQGGVILSMIFIFCIGTIRNPNLDPSEQELSHLKKYSRIFVLIVGSIVITFIFLFPLNHFVYYSALGVLYNALSLLIAKIKGEEVVDDDK